MKGKGASGFVGLMRKSKKGVDAHNEEMSDDDEFWNPDDPRNQTRVIVDKSKTLKWFWHQFRLNCYYLAEHSTFDYAILGVIVLNSVMISLQTVDKLKYCHPFMRDPAIEHLFVKQLEVYFFYVYLFECVVKITGLGVIEYFKSGMNIFDFFLIVAGCEWVDIISQFVYPNMSAIEMNCEALLKRDAQGIFWMGTSRYLEARYNSELLEGMQISYSDPCSRVRALTGSDQDNAFFEQLNILKSLKFLKVLKALRALRAIRTIRIVRSLQVIARAILTTIMNDLMSLIVVLMVILTILAVLGMRFFRPTDITRGNILGEQYTNEHFNSWFSSMMSLVNIFLVDGWYDMYSHWLKEDGTFRFETASSFDRIPTIYFVVSLMVLHFIIFNMFVGINITNVQEANSEYHAEITEEKEAGIRRKRLEIMERQYADVRRLKDKQKYHSKTGGSGDFYDMIAPFKKTLSSKDYAISDSVITELNWIDLELDTLDMMDDQVYRLQQLFFEMSHILSMKASEHLSKAVHGQQNESANKENKFKFAPNFGPDSVLPNKKK